MARDAQGRFVSGNGRGRLVWDENTLTARIPNLDMAVNKAMAAAVEFEATRAQARMRSDAPWNDQTGNARNGLMAEAFHSLGRHGIDLYHSVPYGIWLEVRWGGRYAIIEPTLRSAGVEVMTTLAGLLNGMKV